MPSERVPWLHEKAEKNMIPVWEFRGTNKMTKDRHCRASTLNKPRQPEPSAEALARRDQQLRPHRADAPGARRHRHLQHPTA